MTEVFLVFIFRRIGEIQGVTAAGSTSHASESAGTTAGSRTTTAAANGVGSGRVAAVTGPSDRSSSYDTGTTDDAYGTSSW